MQKIKFKKGLELGEAIPAVLIVATLIILVILGVFMISSMQNSFVNLKTVTQINETTSAVVTPLGVYLSNYTACNFASPSIISATNSSSNTFIPATNYTVTSTGLLKFTDGSSLGFNNSVWKVSYTYTWGGEACNAGRDLTNQTTTSIPLVGIVLTVILITIILGILVSLFRRNQQL